MSTQRILWLDVVKALCMICVMYAHCESYYSIPVAEGFTDIFHPFYVSAFYFVSGYLLISSCISKSTIGGGAVLECDISHHSTYYAIQYSDVLAQTIIPRYRT